MKSSTINRFSVSLLTMAATASLASAQSTSNTWDTNATGNWTDALNWLGDAAYAEGADNTATFGDFISANTVINLNTGITIGNITASDTSHNYTISGANILTLDRTSGVPVIDVTASGRTLFITSTIAGSDGLQKDGAGILDLKNSTNTFSGNIVINGGQLTINNDANLGNTANDIVFSGNATLRTEGAVSLGADRTITINDGVTATLTSTNDGDTFQGVLAGSGTLYANHATDFIFSNTANTFTGAVLSTTGVAVGYGLTFASLSDEAGDGNISLDEGSFHWTGTGGTKTFNDRQFILSGGNGRDGVITNKSSDGSALVITQNFGVTGTGTKFLNLAGTSVTTNTFGGDIGDGASSGLTLNVGANSHKTNWAITGDLSHTGLTWAHGGGSTTVEQATLGQLLLSGTNTNTGGFRVTNNATLVFQGEQSLAADNAIALEHGGGSNNSSRLRLLSDTAGTIFLDNTINLVTANASGIQTIFVGNNNTANLGTSSGTTTGSTIRVSELNFSTIASNTNAAGVIAQITGANDYRLQIDNVTLNNLANRAALTTTNMGFNPTTANVTIGNITQANGNVNNAVAILNLQGSSLDNRITGTISDAADFTDNSNSGAAALQVLKTNTAGVWTLSGDNTYTGSTTIAGGTLAIGGSGRLGGGNYAGAISIASTNSGTLIFNSTANQTLSGVISGAGAFEKNNTGALTLSGTNSYTGATNVNGGILTFSNVASKSSGSAVTAAAAGTVGLGVKTGDAAYYSATDVGDLFNSTLSGFTLDASSGVAIDTTNAGGSFDQTVALSGSRALTKLGTGTLILSQANTYTGATTVTGGKLAINGSITSAVTVQTGATLQGNGSITGAVTVQSGGFLSTGNSIESLTITGNLTQQAGSTFAYEINNDVALAVAGDLTAVSGDVTLGSGALLTLTELGSGSWGVGEKLTLLSYSGSLTGLFTYNSATLADDSTFDFSGATWQFNYNDTVAGSNYTSDLLGSNYITMTVIPEPKAALLGALGVLLLLRRRR